MICGWIVTETGRQPWVAYGVLRTADAVSPVAAHTVATTLVLFVLVYGIVFAMGIYYINRLIARGPRSLRCRPPGLPAPAWSGTAGLAREARPPETSNHRRPHHGILSPGHLGRDHGPRGRDVRDPRRLRSRRRHPVPVRRDRTRTRPDDEFRRSVLGRQRDVARARRRRHDGRLPARLFDHSAGALSAGHRHAAGAGISRSRIRVPLDRYDQQAALDLRLCRRFGARGLLPRRDSRRPDPGHQSGERSVCRRRLRLGNAVRGLCGLGVVAGYALARCHVARHEDARAVSPNEQGSRPSCCCWRCSALWRS